MCAYWEDTTQRASRTSTNNGAKTSEAFQRRQSTNLELPLDWQPGHLRSTSTNSHSKEILTNYIVSIRILKDVSLNVNLWLQCRALCWQLLDSSQRLRDNLPVSSKKALNKSAIESK